MSVSNPVWGTGIHLEFGVLDPGGGRFATDLEGDHLIMNGGTAETSTICKGCEMRSGARVCKPEPATPTRVSPRSPRAATALAEDNPGGVPVETAAGLPNCLSSEATRG